MWSYVLLLPLSLLLFSDPGLCSTIEDAGYIGSKSCSQCHEQQYKNYTAYSKKAHAWEAVAIMKPKLKENELRQCYECHTTGYGKKGGFVSKESTPDLADVGCETCHGPGAAHAASGDPKLIARRPSTQTCAQCHNSQRVQDFNFKPLIFSGAH